MQEADAVSQNLSAVETRHFEGNFAAGALSLLGTSFKRGHTKTDLQHHTIIPFGKQISNKRRLKLAKQFLSSSSSSDTSKFYTSRPKMGPQRRGHFYLSKGMTLGLQERIPPVAEMLTNALGWNQSRYADVKQWHRLPQLCVYSERGRTRAPWSCTTRLYN